MYARTTRDIYMKYKMSGYSKKFFEEHRAEIEIHKNARKIFSEYSGAIPKVTELNLELSQLKDRKKKAYADYRQVKRDMKDFQSAKSNINSFLKKEKSSYGKEIVI